MVKNLISQIRMCELRSFTVSHMKIRIPSTKKCGYSITLNETTRLDAIKTDMNRPRIFFIHCLRVLNVHQFVV